MRQRRFSASEFAQLLGISKGALLEKERQGSVPPARRGGNNFRYFTPEDIPRYREALGLAPLITQKRTQLFLNFKGGTGKSSVSSSYGYRVAEMGLRVLLLDLDPQAHLTKCLGFEGSSFDYTLFNVLVQKIPIQEAIVKTKMGTLDLLPSNINLSPIELSLTSLNAREYRLRKALMEVHDDYDVIIMDAPPNIGLLNLNAILASNDMLVPVLADFLSYEALRILFETLSSIEEDFEFILDNIHIVLNRYNDSQNICKSSKKALERNYSEYLMETTIRQDTKIADATSKGAPIFQYAPSSRGATDIAAMVDHVFGFSKLNKPVEAAPAKSGAVETKTSSKKTLKKESYAGRI